MKVHHHVTRMRLAVWHILIALAGFIFVLEIVRAYQTSAYLGEETRILNERTQSIQASGSVQ